MNSYGILLKQLIRFTNIKLSTLADLVGYDTSYISKWCNKEKLPASKSAAAVNRTLAEAFAGEIVRQDEWNRFEEVFGIKTFRDEPALASSIEERLKEAYKQAANNHGDMTLSAPAAGIRSLIWPQEITHFFETVLPERIETLNKDVEILCSMDIYTLLTYQKFDKPAEHGSGHTITVKCGFNTEPPRTGLHDYLSLYSLINHYSFVNFSFYDMQIIENMNLIVIRDCMALLCCINDRHEIDMMTIISEPDQVYTLYERLNFAMSRSKLMIQSSDADYLFYRGYRTEFYAHNDFNIFLTRGFEFLLPPQLRDKLIAASKEQHQDAGMGQLIMQLFITMEEIFEKANLDFYLLKTSLMQYIQDGVIYYADVEYTLTKEERKAHIENVKKLCSINPNIRFHIIDDEYLPNAGDLIHINVYSNGRKLFLKNPETYRKGDGPRFYTVHCDKLIQEITQYFAQIRTSPYCNSYDSEGVLKFYERYGTMIGRFIELDGV